MPRDPYARFAKYFDLVYEGIVDYDGDARWLQKVFRRHAAHVSSVLDLGCGTGNHAVRLARGGFEVVGLDRTQALLAVARGKAGAHGVEVAWHRGDMKDFRLRREFDAAICMFGGFGYLLGRDAERALRRVHRHLRPGGIFIFEFWCRGGVRGSGIRSWNDVEKDGVRLIRHGESRLDRRAQTLDLTLRHTVIRQGRVTEEFAERHRIRVYRRQAMRSLLRASGFRVLAFYGWDDMDHGFRKPTPKEFRIIAVARRVQQRPQGRRGSVR